MRNMLCSRPALLGTSFVESQGEEKGMDLHTGIISEYVHKSHTLQATHYVQTGPALMQIISSLSYQTVLP